MELEDAVFEIPDLFFSHLLFFNLIDKILLERLQDSILLLLSSLILLATLILQFCQIHRSSNLMRDAINGHPSPLGFIFLAMVILYHPPTLVHDHVLAFLRAAAVVLGIDFGAEEDVARIVVVEVMPQFSQGNAGAAAAESNSDDVEEDV